MLSVQHALQHELATCHCSVYEEVRSARVSKFRKAGFKTRAAVIVLPDSSLFRRQRKQHQEEGKSVPETTIADMRGVLSLVVVLCLQKCAVVARLSCHTDCARDYSLPC